MPHEQMPDNNYLKQLDVLNSWYIEAKKYMQETRKLVTRLYKQGTHGLH